MVQLNYQARLFGIKIFVQMFGFSENVNHLVDTIRVRFDHLDRLVFLIVYLALYLIWFKKKEIV